jgi:hypothetical protein
MFNRTWRVVVIAVTVIAATGAIAGVAAQAATGCRADYAVSAQWPGGFTANVNFTGTPSTDGA